MSYQRGDLKDSDGESCPATDSRQAPDESKPLGQRYRDPSDRFGRFCFLPHSCGQWIVGGRDEAQALIDDLTEWLGAGRYTDDERAWAVSEAAEEAVCRVMDRLASVPAWDVFCRHCGLLFEDRSQLEAHHHDFALTPGPQRCYGLVPGQENIGLIIAVTLRRLCGGA